MKFFFLSFIYVFCLVSFCFGKSNPPVKVRVLKDNTNLRAKAGLNYEVAGQMMTDQELTAKSIDSNWVEVVAPTNIDFWILGDYLNDGLVVCRKNVNVRAGPGINFSIVGQMRNSDRVEVRGSHMDWIKIAPPENCSLWVSRPLVEIVLQTPPTRARTQEVKQAPVESKITRETGILSAEGSAATADEKKTKPSKPSKPEVITRAETVSGSEEGKTQEAVKTAAEVKPPEDLDLIPVGQGQMKQFRGILKSKNFLVRSPSSFRLVANDEDGRSRTVCFVKGNRAQLRALLFRDLVVIGRQYWVHRHRQPVVVPEKIILK